MLLERHESTVPLTTDSFEPRSGHAKRTGYDVVPNLIAVTFGAYDSRVEQHCKMFHDGLTRDVVVPCEH